MLDFLNTVKHRIADATGIHGQHTQDMAQQLAALELTEDQDYVLQPLDAVLFAGGDPVAKFIKKIELHEVVPRISSPFHELWTHAGILVNKEVLPLDFLEDGKMYLYESVFSGEVAGYVYSRVLPLDHAVAKGGFHLGPQIRDFAAVVAEGDSDVGIAPLSLEQRRFMQNKLKENPHLILDLYKQYHEFGYPITNILPVIASASQNLYKDLEYFNKISTEFFPGHHEKKTTVFCSELVSIIYKSLGLPSFTNASPDTFTPLAVEVQPEFGNIIFYAKEGKVQRLVAPHDRITTKKHITKSQQIINSSAIRHHWQSMPPSGGIPATAVPVGHDARGEPLYVARAKIGKGFHLGRMGAEDAAPRVTYFDREVPVRFGHEVLVSLEGLEFVDVTVAGTIPEGAVAVGLEDDGETPLYLVRGVVGESKGLLGVGGHKGELVPGVIAGNLKRARIGHEGVEVQVDKYQVLVRK